VTTDKEKLTRSKGGRKDRAAEIAHTFEWLITAFILAFLFRTFVMEAFRIPTGSMADTLMGAHFRLRCTQCGYPYEYGYDPRKYGMPRDTMPRGQIRGTYSRCPNCGYYQPTGSQQRLVKGDRILVLKCIYQFFEPQRWDVTVFKNPLEPNINYIKRLVGLPGEKLEIIDGDVYIDGEIARKPAKVQKELWMPVYNNDYQPARPLEGRFNGHVWKQPFRPVGESRWRVDNDSPAMFVLNSEPSELSFLRYDTSLGNNFRATYAYNDVDQYSHRPFCSDLKLRFYVQKTAAPSLAGVSLSKYGVEYRGWINDKGQMVIGVRREDRIVELDHKETDISFQYHPVLLSFANVDHRLILQAGEQKLIVDLGDNPDALSPRRTSVEPQAQVFGSGELTLSHIALYRDTHYTRARPANGKRVGRAGEGNPIVLKDGEYFMLGDNSPNSADSRWWDRPGVGNNQLEYRPGIVPSEYLVGKAFFVYWPSGFRLFDGFPLRVVPDIGRMRFIYGGGEQP